MRVEFTSVFPLLLKAPLSKLWYISIHCISSQKIEHCLSSPPHIDIYIHHISYKTIFPYVFSFSCQFPLSSITTLFHAFLSCIDCSPPHKSAHTSQLSIMWVGFRCTLLCDLLPAACPLWTLCLTNLLSLSSVVPSLHSPRLPLRLRSDRSAHALLPIQVRFCFWQLKPLCLSWSSLYDCWE